MFLNLRIYYYGLSFSVVNYIGVVKAISDYVNSYLDYAYSLLDHEKSDVIFPPSLMSIYKVGNTRMFLKFVLTAIYLNDNASLLCYRFFCYVKRKC